MKGVETMKWGLVLFVCIMGLTASLAEAKKVPEIRCLDQKAFEVLRVQGNIVDLDRRLVR